MPIVRAFWLTHRASSTWAASKPITCASNAIGSTRSGRTMAKPMGRRTMCRSGYYTRSPPGACRWTMPCGCRHLSPSSAGAAFSPWRPAGCACKSFRICCCSPGEQLSLGFSLRRPLLLHVGWDLFDQGLATLNRHQVMTRPAASHSAWSADRCCARCREIFCPGNGQARFLPRTTG